MPVEEVIGLLLKNWDDDGDGEVSGEEMVRDGDGDDDDDGGNDGL